MKNLLFLFLVSAPVLPCSALTLIQEDFTGTAGSGLIGTTPDTTVSGTAWAGHAGYVFTATNSVTSTTAGGTGATVDLGASYFSTNPGIYTLTADVFFPSGTTSTSVYGIGFGATTAGTSTAQSFANSGYFGEPWIFLRGTGAYQVRSGTTNFLAAEGTGFTPGVIYTLKLILNTSGTAWTVDAYINTTQLDLNGATAGQSYTYTTNPTSIRVAGLASTIGGSTGTVDNFLLTYDAVPEPSAAALAGLAALGCCTLRRRRI